MADADRESDLWPQSNVNAQTGEQLEIIDLVQDDVSIVGDSAALLVNLGTNDVALVVHLVACIARVILVVPKIDPGVPTVPLKSSDQRRTIPATAGGIFCLVKRLIVDLLFNGLVLRNNLVASIPRTILVETVVFPGVARVGLRIPNIFNPVIEKTGTTVRLVVLLLITGRQTMAGSRARGQRQRQRTAYREHQPRENTIDPISGNKT